MDDVVVGRDGGRLALGAGGEVVRVGLAQGRHVAAAGAVPGEDPAVECARTRAMPTLREVYADYLTSKWQEIRSVLVRHGEVYPGRKA